MGVFKTRWILWVGALISLGVFACTEMGNQANETIDDKDCYISYKKGAVAIDMEFVECCAGINGEEELERCIEEADEQGDENYHEFKDCPSTGSCLDNCQGCLSDCDRYDDGCRDLCFSEMENCSLWYDTGCIEACAVTRDKCWSNEMDDAFNFTDIDWDLLQKCLLDFDICSDDCIA